MSGGHRHHHSDRHVAQYDALSHQPWFQLALERPYLVIGYVFDLPYVGGSSEGTERIYVDRHAYPVIVKAGLLPGLIKHELVEGILLDHGWKYEIEPEAAHLVASVAEERENLKRGILRQDADEIYRPLIKADEHERLVIVPDDLHMQPYLEPPVDKALIAHMRRAMRDPFGLSPLGV